MMHLQSDFNVDGNLERKVIQPHRIQLTFLSERGETFVDISRVDGQVEVVPPRMERGGERVTIVEGMMPIEYLVPDSPNALAIVERLRKEFAARGEIDDVPRFEKESESFVVNFKAPGYLAVAVIRCDGNTRVTHHARGIGGILLDLHRGKDSGWIWALIIDFVAIVFVVVSITGLILWSSLKGRAQNGGSVLLLGLLTSLAIYFTLVPR